MDKICIIQMCNFPILLVSTSDARVGLLLCCEEIKQVCSILFLKKKQQKNTVLKFQNMLNFVPVVYIEKAIWSDYLIGTMHI